MPRWTSSVSAADAEQQVLAAPVERVDRAPGRCFSERSREPASATAGRTRAWPRPAGRRRAGARPRRVVSTSGSSGIAGQNDGSARGAAAPVCCAAEYTLTSIRFRPFARRADAADPRHAGRPPWLDFRRFASPSPSRRRWRRARAGARAGAAAAQPPSAAGRSSAGRRRAPTRAEQGSRAELMYRLLLGDVALQRGEPALAARAYFEAARETRDPRSRGAPPKSRWRARQRALALESARAVERARPDGASARSRSSPRLRAAPAGKGFDSPGVGNDLKAELERVLADAATSPAALGEAFLQLNRLLAQRAGQAGDAASSSQSLAQPYPDLAGGALRRRARRVQHRARRTIDVDRRRCAQIDRALRAEAGLGARGAAQGARSSRKRSPDRADRLPRRVHRGAPGLEGRGRRARAALRRAEALRRRARDLRDALGQRTRPIASTSSAIAALAVQMKDWATRRNAVRGPEARRLRRERRRRALSRADRRGDRPLRRSRSSAIAPCPTASARGSRSCASRRCSAS